MKFILSASAFAGAASAAQAAGLAAVIAVSVVFTAAHILVLVALLRAGHSRHTLEVLDRLPALILAMRGRDADVRRGRRGS